MDSLNFGEDGNSITLLIQNDESSDLVMKEDSDQEINWEVWLRLCI